MFSLVPSAGDGGLRASHGASCVPEKGSLRLAIPCAGRRSVRGLRNLIAGRDSVPLIRVTFGYSSGHLREGGCAGRRDGSPPVSASPPRTQPQDQQ